MGLGHSASPEVYVLPVDVWALDEGPVPAFLRSIGVRRFSDAVTIREARGNLALGLRNGAGI